MKVGTQNGDKIAIFVKLPVFEKSKWTAFYIFMIFRTLFYRTLTQIKQGNLEKIRNEVFLKKVTTQVKSRQQNNSLKSKIFIKTSH